MSAEPESFLARWSRRKLAAEREAERPAADTAAPQVPHLPAAKPGEEGVAAKGPVSAPSSVREPAPATEMPLPPIESLDGLRSDYQAFFQQPVADELRHAALKKLFADPHFNQMDMLDVYVDDYTQFEPLPAALRVRLPSARDFLLDSERAALEATEAATGAPGDAPEILDATAGEEGDPAVIPDAADERSFATDETSVESTSALTKTPDAAPAGVGSVDEPAEFTEPVSTAVVPPRKSRAPDPTSP